MLRTLILKSLCFVLGEKLSMVYLFTQIQVLFHLLFMLC